MVQAAPLWTDSIPESARAVIIGGWIAGTSVACMARLRDIEPAAAR